MYADTELMFNYFHNSLEIQQFDDYFPPHKSFPSMESLLLNSPELEYDLGGEGDLFKAPEPIIKEQTFALDPITTMNHIGEDIISPQLLKEVADMESIQSEQFFSEVFYECKKETPLSEVLSIKIPAPISNEYPNVEEEFVPNGAVVKSASSDSLSSMEWIQGTSVRPSFLDFPEIDFGAVYKMRRAYSDGDIKAFGNGNVSIIHSPHGQPQLFGNSITEDRSQKLSRYRNKKSKRNFGRKIKYACRKALADSQPRIRGRFAKTDESDISKRLYN